MPLLEYLKFYLESVYVGLDDAKQHLLLLSRVFGIFPVPPIECEDITLRVNAKAIAKTVYVDIFSEK